MHPWHGAAKTAVTQHFLDREPEVAAKGVTPGTIDSTFENLVAAAYSKEGGSYAAKRTSPKSAARACHAMTLFMYLGHTAAGATALITPEFPKWASECRASGIKIGRYIQARFANWV